MFATRERPTAQAPRPLMPKLATTTTSPRSSPTPRLNAQSALSPTTRSPTARKPLSVVNSSAPSRPSPASGRSTPNKSFVGSDTTLRSASRLSRVDNAVSTPPGTMRRTNGTVQSPSTSSNVRPTVARGVSARSGLSERDVKATGMNGIVPRMSPRLARPQLEPAAEIKGPLFLHASDAPAPKIVERPLPKKMASFIYANGEVEEGSNEETAQGAIDRSKFPSTLQPVVSEALSTEDEGDGLSAQLETTTFDSVPSQHRSPPLVGSGSSIKADIQLPHSKASSSFIRSPDENPIPVPAQPQMSRRVSGLDTVLEPVSHHNRAGSTPSTNSAVLARLSSADTNATYPGMRVKRSSLTFSSPTPPTSPGARSKRSSLNLAVPSTVPTSPSANHVSSPTPKQVTDSPSQQQQPQQTTLEVATSARHERKLLDLEISNSSLLAINRTLEREVTKQKTELRRLRRATSDRTSWQSDAATEISEEGVSLLSAGGDDDLERLDKFDYGDNDSSRRSSGRRVSSKMLDLDLGKHKELLIDSQKMNLSLQRCLGITDQLIKDADKALEFRVHIISLPDDEDELENRFSYGGNRQKEDEETEADEFFKTWGALSSRSKSSPPRPAIHSNTFEPPTEEPEDKDSGIDVEYTETCAPHPDSADPGEKPKPVDDSVGGWRKEEDTKVMGTPLHEMLAEMF